MSPEDELRSVAQRRVGTVLRGKYRVDGVLGVGGMAVVYRVTHRNQAEFALKMLHPELSVRDDVRTRFLREGYAANSVKHPGAVVVVDDDVSEDGAAFLVMELLDGAPVEALWEQCGRRMPIPAAAAAVHQLLDVLAAAHAKNIVHRDIKPANVFVTRDGGVKVLDFGIARLRDAMSATGATATGMMMGTPGFMAPEQALGKSSDVDGQADVWAAGATLFALLSGRLLHEESAGDTPQQLMIRAATQPARSLATVAPGMPPLIVRVVDVAVAFEKAARWPGAAAMRDALHDAYAQSFGAPMSRQPLAELVAGTAASAQPSAGMVGQQPAARVVISSPGTGASPGVSGAYDGTRMAPGLAPTGTPQPARVPLPATPYPAQVPLPATPHPAPVPLPATPYPMQVPLSATPHPVQVPPSAAVEPEVAAATRRRSLAVPIAIGATLGVTLGAVAAIRLVGGAGKATTSAASATVAASVATQAPAAQSAAAPTAVTLAEPSSSKPPQSPPVRPARPASTATPVAAKGGPAPPATAVPTGGKPNCNPPYTVDGAGNKHFRPECF